MVKPSVIYPKLISVSFTFKPAVSQKFSPSVNSTSVLHLFKSRSSKLLPFFSHQTSSESPDNIDMPLPLLSFFIDISLVQMTVTSSRLFGKDKIEQH